MHLITGKWLSAEVVSLAETGKRISWRRGGDFHSEEDFMLIDLSGRVAISSDRNVRADVRDTKWKPQAPWGPAFLGQVTQAMQGLGMQGGRFEVRLEPCDAGPGGLESVEFLVAGHAGSTPRALAKVASGGELSRLALAIAVTTAVNPGRGGEAGAATLIFDEIDSGVGGTVADSVGALMKRLGRSTQVLAVTHLPQVAACADHHMLVSKQLQGKNTLSTVAAIQGEQRVGEIARMLGGEKLSSTTLAHAKEMLQAGT